MKSILFLFFIFSVICVFGKQIKLKKQEHSYSESKNPSVFLNKYVNPNNQRVGNSVPLNGGLLTIGTYTADITIGNQNFTILLDTGSSNLAVASSTCESCGKGDTFNPSQSQSFRYMKYASQDCKKCSPQEYFHDTSKCVYGEPLEVANGNCGIGVTYGGASSALVGSLGFDEVCFGGYCVKEHNFGLISNEYPPSGFSEYPYFSGLLGLAFEMNACNPTCTTPIFDSIVSSYGIKDLFGLCLNPSKGGMLDLGEIETSRYTGEIYYTNITTHRWYNMNLLDISVGGTGDTISTSDDGTSIGIPELLYKTTNDVIGNFIDSGTSVILTSPLAFQYLTTTFQNKYCDLPGVCGNNSMFNENGGGCISASEMGDHVKDFPKVGFTFPNAQGGKFTVNVPPSAYLMKYGNQYCLGLASAIGIGAVLGDVFLENLYSVHDRVNNRVGFAKVDPNSCK